MNQTAHGNENCYLAYGIGESISGFPSSLSSIQLGDLSLFFKDVPDEEYGENYLDKHVKDIEWLEKNIVEFQKHLGDLILATTLIPFPFGTVYTSKSSMENFILKYGKHFKKNIRYFSDKFEWGLKVFLSESKFRNWNIQNESGSVPERIESPGAYFFQRKQSEYAAREKEEDVLKTILERIVGSVTPLSVEWKEIEFLDGLEKDSNSLNPVYNLSLLVKKDVSADLAHCVNSIKEELSMYGMKARLSGPWPPYNFINMEKHN